MPVARRSVTPARAAFTLTVAVEPVVDAVRRHVRLSPAVLKELRQDLSRVLQVDRVVSAVELARGLTAPTDPVMGTQEAADLVGVSRPYLVARIDAGHIALHQQVGNRRRVLKSAVLAWHKREQARRRRALALLGAELDSEIFAG